MFEVKVMRIFGPREEEVTEGLGKLHEGVGLLGYAP
jgi:hypothetical protein